MPGPDDRDERQAAERDRPHQACRDECVREGEEREAREERMPRDALDPARRADRACEEVVRRSGIGYRPRAQEDDPRHADGHQGPTERCHVRQCEPRCPLVAMRCEVGDRDGERGGRDHREERRETVLAEPSHQRGADPSGREADVSGAEDEPKQGGGEGGFHGVSSFPTSAVAPCGARSSPTRARTTGPA